MLIGFWGNDPTLPSCDFVVTGWWDRSITAAHWIVPIVPVSASLVSAEAWRAECQRARAYLDERGVMPRVAAVCVAPELYGAVTWDPGFQSMLATLSYAQRVGLAHWWYDHVGVPIAREVFDRAVMVEEQTYGPSTPVPMQADVLCYLAYDPYGMFSPATFQHFVSDQLAYLKRVAPTKTIHVVGQAFRAENDPMWATFPPVAWMEATRAFCVNNGVFALSWFMWSGRGYASPMHGLNEQPGDVVARLIARPA